jgi:polyhydroxybutyrate depolymerase
VKRPITSLALVVLAAGLTGCASGADRSDAQPATTTDPPTTTTTVPACTVTTDLTTQRIDLTVDGVPRYALVRLPAGWDGTTSVPLVLSFHGLGSNAAQQMTNDNFAALADQHGFIVAYPNAGGDLGALGAAWKLASDDDDAPFVDALLDNLEQKACIDPARVYATGLSYGGAMTDLVACKLADRIAAAAPVSAYIPDQPCASTTGVPTMAFHGVEDMLLPYDGGGNAGQLAFEDWGATIAKRNGCATEPTETQYVPTVEQLEYQDCGEPVVLYRVHGNGHTWPGHPLGLPRDALIDLFSGKTTGKPFPLMVVLGLTPEQFADSIFLANQDIDASSMIWNFFSEHTLGERN